MHVPQHVPFNTTRGSDLSLIREISAFFSEAKQVSHGWVGSWEKLHENYRLMRKRESRS